MATVSESYGTSTAFTITLASLANNGSRASTAVSNTSTLALDALVSLVVKTNASGVSSTGYLTVYAYGTTNGGSNYTEGATGTDGAITLTSPTNLRPIGIINAVATATTYTAGPFSVANAFGGSLPSSWGIVVTNSTGATLDATTASANYQTVSATVA